MSNLNRRDMTYSQDHQDCCQTMNRPLQQRDDKPRLSSLTQPYQKHKSKIKYAYLALILISSYTQSTTSFIQPTPLFRSSSLSRPVRITTQRSHPLHPRTNIPPMNTSARFTLFSTATQEFKTKKGSRGRPRGRPESVPGAISKTTMRQQTAALIIEVEKNDKTTTTTAATTAKVTTKTKSVSNDETSSTTTFTTPKRGRGRPRKNSLAIPITKRNKNVENDEMGADKTTTYQLKGDRINLQEYYDTELLTAEEEYSLGMKVRFMMKCEDVHEGLYACMGRNPTFDEWAKACGFVNDDPEFSSPDYIESPLVSSLRPNGNSLDHSPDNIDPSTTTTTQEMSPDFFVGNTIANNTGVGRGRGRARKSLPITLPPFHDDSAEKFGKDDRQSSSPSSPVNTGSPRDFLERLLDGRDAKARMVECNMRLVVSIARRYWNVGVNIQDLVQEGSLGLMRAAEKFIPSKGFKFSTYASWWIQQAVFRSIAYNSRTIRLPVHVHNWLNRVRRVRTTLQADLGRPPTNDEIASELDMTTVKFNKMVRLTRRTISLEKPKYQNNPRDLGHESEARLGDTVDSSSAIRDDTTPEQKVDQGLFQSDLKEMMKILSDDERRVVSLRYGLEDGLTRTVTNVALQMHRTKAWVRSQECRALRKLRRPWYEKTLKEHQKSIMER